MDFAAPLSARAAGTAGVDDQFEEFFAAVIILGFDFFAGGVADEHKNRRSGQSDAGRWTGFEEIFEGNHSGV